MNIKRTIPNILTAFRILTVPFLVALMLGDGSAYRICAAVVFLLAGITDFFDGYLARHWRAQSLFGRLLDPIADKMLVITALVMLIEARCLTGMHVIPAIIIISRDLFISGAREFLVQYDTKINASHLAQWKTGAQMTAVNCLLTSGTVFDKLYLSTIGLYLLWIAAGLAVYTLLDYMRIFKDGSKFSS